MFENTVKIIISCGAEGATEISGSGLDGLHVDSEQISAESTRIHVDATQRPLFLNRR